MYANFQTMQNNCSTSAMFAEAAAFVCAFLLVGSAIIAESIFAVILSIIIVLVRVLKMT